MAVMGELLGGLIATILMTAVIRHLFLSSNHKRMAWAVSALIAAPLLFVGSGIGDANGGPFSAMVGLRYAGLGWFVAAIAAGWAKFRQDAEYIYVRPKRWVLVLCWSYLVLMLGMSAMIIATDGETIFGGGIDDKIRIDDKTLDLYNKYGQEQQVEEAAAEIIKQTDEMSNAEDLSEIKGLGVKHKIGIDSGVRQLEKLAKHDVSKQYVLELKENSAIFKQQGVNLELMDPMLKKIEAEPDAFTVEDMEKICSLFLTNYQAMVRTVVLVGRRIEYLKNPNVVRDFQFTEDSAATMIAALEYKYTKGQENVRVERQALLEGWGCEVPDTEFKETTFSVGYVMEMTRRLNKSTPIQVDEITVLESVSAEEMTVTYKYKVTLNGASFDVDVVANQAYPNMCADEDTLITFNGGIKYHFKYYDELGRDVGHFEATAASCRQEASF
jgi:hypothetical protein